MTIVERLKIENGPRNSENSLDQIINVYKTSYLIGISSNEDLSIVGKVKPWKSIDPMTTTAVIVNISSLP